MTKIELQDYEIDIKKIKPKNIKKSDKYSKEIYKYLKDNHGLRRVWFDEAAYDGDEPIRKQFDISNIDFRNLYFGIPEDTTSKCIHGKCINSLIIGGQGSQETYCYLCYKHSHFVEVTKEFYEKYIEIGRCIYGHKSYLADTDGRYTYIDDTHRICNWCGNEQHEETVTHTYKSKVWVDN